MNTKLLFEALQRPALYQKSEGEFWNDSYISEQMLKAHLNNEWDAASRKLSFIKKSVDFIRTMVPPEEAPELLDIGCGPGIYAELFQDAGYHVTGVDFSERSICYAKQKTEEKHSGIRYLFQNYLTMELSHQYDIITLIYCDYGALSTEDRKTVLQKAYEHLKPGGKLFFDVFTMKYYEKLPEYDTTEYCENGGFWRPDRHLCLNHQEKFSDCVNLSRTVVISENSIDTYFIWDTDFTEERLVDEVTAEGFLVKKIYGDVAGAALTKESETMAILLEKE